MCMQSALMLIRQLNEGRHEVENEYTRVVTREGNRKAKALVAEVFELRRAFEWRGLGLVPYSALRIKRGVCALRCRAALRHPRGAAGRGEGLRMPAIIRGVKQPTDCKLFGTVCTPDNPMGSCMVSSEGACAAYWSYGRFRRPEGTDGMESVA